MAKRPERGAFSTTGSRLEGPFHTSAPEVDVGGFHSRGLCEGLCTPGSLRRQGKEHVSWVRGLQGEEVGKKR